jgi:hypothetical protein
MKRIKVYDNKRCVTLHDIRNKFIFLQSKATQSGKNDFHI